MFLQLEANHCFLLTASRENWAALQVCVAACAWSVAVCSCHTFTRVRIQIIKSLLFYETDLLMEVG